MTSGAQFEILADGKTRSFRDARVGDGPPLTIARQPEKIEAFPQRVCVMNSRPPYLDVDVHLVLCDFGRAGLAYVETDPVEADATTIVQNLLHGQYEQPLRVIAINAEEGWSRDVSESIAAKVRDVAEHELIELTSGTLDFIQAHIGRARQPTLPLW
jgi:hypothetical protein